MLTTRSLLLVPLVFVGCSDALKPAPVTSASPEPRSRGDAAEPQRSADEVDDEPSPTADSRPLPLPAPLLRALKTFEEREGDRRREYYEKLDRLLTAELERNPRAAAILG